MFPNRYFPSRYFPARYFPKTGEPVVPPTLELPTASTSSYRNRIRNALRRLRDNRTSATSYLEDAMARIREQRSQNVIYARGTSSVQVAVVVGKTTSEQDVSSDGGVVLRVPHRDYIVEAASLSFTTGVVTRPQHGDVITEEDGSKFEVRPIGGEPCWRFSDSTRTNIRIHAQEVKDA